MHDQPVNPASGYYGKTPATGDFIKYNLPRAFIEPWDDWLQNVLSFSRQQMGEGWLDAYLTSPIYRFVLTAGICGETGWQGVIMPSVDRVGRYFPMTICTPMDPVENPFERIFQQEHWFAQAEALVLSVLEDGFSAEILSQSMQALDATNHTSNLSAMAMPNSSDGLGNSLAVREALPDNDIDPQTLYPELLNSVLLETGFAYSLWRTAGSEHVPASMLLAQGLPPAESAVAMLDGNWSRWGWMDKQPSLTVISTTSNDDTRDPWDD